MPSSDSKTSKQAASRSQGWLNRYRALCVGLLILIGSLGFGVYVAVHWVERQVLTPDNWVALVGPLPKKPVVSDALGGYISDQVFRAADVRQRIADALPPKAGFLAAPLASQVHSIATRASQNLVASDQFQTIWIGANRLAISRVVAEGRGTAPLLQAKIHDKFNLDISGANGQLSKALGSAANAIPALEPASQKALNISADLKTRPYYVRKTVKAVDYLSVVLPLFVATCFLFAFALSPRRRHTAMTISVTLIVVMLLELISLKGARQEVLNQVHNAANLPAISYIFDTLTGWLKSMIISVIVLALLAMGVLAAGGPYDWAQKLRSYIRIDRLKRSQAMDWWHIARGWAKQWQYYLWLAGAIIVLAYLALFATINGRAALNALLAIIGLCSLIHIVATPPATSGQRGRL